MTIAITANPLVHVNALLNAAAAVLLLVGLAMIKRGRVTAHKRLMLAAFTISAAFLACYVWYHYHAGHVEFTYPGAVRYAYFTILGSHVLLALTVPVLAVWTIYLGLRATGSWGDCPLFLSRSDEPQHDCEQEKGTVPLGMTLRREGDSPLLVVGGERESSVAGCKKGTVPDNTYRQRHCRLAHWTFPIWLYVSITGVVVYVMLYHLWPPV